MKKKDSKTIKIISWILAVIFILAFFIYLGVLALIQIKYCYLMSSFENPEIATIIKDYCDGNLEFNDEKLEEDFIGLSQTRYVAILAALKNIMKDSNEETIAEKEKRTDLTETDKLILKRSKRALPCQKKLLKIVEENLRPEELTYIQRRVYEKVLDYQ